MILVHQPSKIYCYSEGEMEGQYNSYSPVKMIVTVASMKGFCLYFLKMLLIFSELIKGERHFVFFCSSARIASYCWDTEVICCSQQSKAIMHLCTTFPLGKTICWWYKWQLFALLGLQTWQSSLIVSMYQKTFFLCSSAVLRGPK